ncbi:MAG: OB-fold domain-containing protein [Solirubrobacterales bacterium]|nr:OB-fold domain-containing protein [Solirubrobacterales bacterium]
MSGAASTGERGVTLAAARPIADGLFVEVGGEVRLLGSECGRCGVVTFPRQASCRRCTSTAVSDRLLARRGTLWTWTIQAFPPKSPPYAVADPEAFEPYGVGYVELPNEVRVEARLTVADPDKLRTGMAMELTLIPAPGAEPDVVTYAFRPVEEEEAQ